MPSDALVPYAESSEEDDSNDVTVPAIRDDNIAQVAQATESLYFSYNGEFALLTLKIKDDDDDNDNRTWQ